MQFSATTTALFISYVLSNVLAHPSTDEESSPTNLSSHLRGVAQTKKIQPPRRGKTHDRALDGNNSEATAASLVTNNASWSSQHTTKGLVLAKGGFAGKIDVSSIASGTPRILRRQDICFHKLQSLAHAIRPTDSRHGR
jgi:hypothetical protein